MKYLLYKNRLNILTINIIFFSFLIIYRLFLPINVNANYIFEENFNSGLLNEWSGYNPYGNWNIIDGEFEYTATPNSDQVFHYLVSGDAQWNNYIYEVRVKGILGSDKIVLFRVNDTNDTYALNIVSLYPGGGNIIHLQRANLTNGILMWDKTYNYVNSPNVWYQIKIITKNLDSGVQIDVYINNDHIISEYDNISPIFNGKIGIGIWPQGIQTTRYDDIFVSSITSDIVPTKKIVFAPGLGATWNSEDIFNCTFSNNNSNWILAPYAEEIYTPLYDVLEKTVGK